MKEYLKYVCAKRKVTVYEVFKFAYNTHYGCAGWVTDDVTTYNLTGEIPLYVELYLEDIRDRPYERG